MHIHIHICWYKSVFIVFIFIHIISLIRLITIYLFSQVYRMIFYQLFYTLPAFPLNNLMIYVRIRTRRLRSYNLSRYPINELLIKLNQRKSVCGVEYGAEGINKQFFLVHKINCFFLPLRWRTYGANLMKLNRLNVSSYSINSLG